MTNPFKQTSNNKENKQMAISLLLFPSQPAVIGGHNKTSFSMTPTEITEANASEFFRSDHTPILFEKGISKSENYKYATCIVFDIDNGHSDAPEKWIRPKDVARCLQELGINYWMSASRNHKKPKLAKVRRKDEDGNVVESQEEKAARPKFHVYLILAIPLYDGDKFVRYCEWCIKTFNADPKVKSKAQKIFGYGDNPNAAVKNWSEGRCIDEVLTDEDLATVAPLVPEQKQTTPIVPLNRPPKESNTIFDWFSESGEWKKHLDELEALGWYFYPEKDGVTYFQTPDGDHSPSKQDGNIKDDVAYFFSKAPPPFENNEGYPIYELFAGALFGDIDREGLVKFAERYFIILNLWEPLASADKFIEAAYSFNGTPTLIHHAGDYWQWRKNAYRQIETAEVESKLLHFLERAKIEFQSDADNNGLPLYGAFPIGPPKLNQIANMVQRRAFQPLNDAFPNWIGGDVCKMPASVTDPSLLIFGKSKILNLENMEMLTPSPYWFNIAALEFDYDPTAECPYWLAFLDSIFGDDEESKHTLMEWMGLCLTTITKFQKALFLIGKIRSGKGTIGRILQKIVGSHNTVTPNSGDFAQPFGLEPFVGKTFAVVSDARFKRGFSPQLTERVLNITGEDTVTINRKNRQILVHRLKTKLMFISNEVPNILDQSGALASRFIFLKLPKSFYGREDIELEDKLSRELSGIQRLAIEHLQILLKRGKFIQPETGIALAKRMTALSSPASEFMQQLPPYMTKDNIWENWKSFCETESLLPGTRNDLWNNLESAGYDCDFDTADILAKIRQRDGKIKVRKLRECFSSTHKYRTSDGGEKFDRKLQEMEKAGLLVIRYEGSHSAKWVEIVEVDE